MNVTFSLLTIWIFEACGFGLCFLTSFLLCNRFGYLLLPVRICLFTIDFLLLYSGSGRPICDIVVCDGDGGIVLGVVLNRMAVGLAWLRWVDWWLGPMVWSDCCLNFMRVGTMQISVLWFCDCRLRLEIGAELIGFLWIFGCVCYWISMIGILCV